MFAEKARKGIIMARAKTEKAVETKAVETKKAATKKAVTKKAEVEKAEEPVAPKTEMGEQFDAMMKAAEEDFDPDSETKEDKFHRIAPGRVSRVLDALRILGHCSNLSTYEYSEAEVDKMFTAIRKKVDAIENNFREKLDYNQEVDFKF